MWEFFLCFCLSQFIVDQMVGHHLSWARVCVTGLHYVASRAYYIMYWVVLCGDFNAPCSVLPSSECRLYCMWLGVLLVAAAT